MEILRISSKGQVTIPKPIRQNHWIAKDNIENSPKPLPVLTLFNEMLILFPNLVTR